MKVKNGLAFAALAIVGVALAKNGTLTKFTKSAASGATILVGGSSKLTRRI